MIPSTRSGNATLGRPGDWFALRQPKTPGDMSTAAKDARAELSGTMGGVLAFIRGREADVVAVVEAVGWERRTQQPPGNNGFPGNNKKAADRRRLAVADPDGLRYRAQAAGFPFAARLHAPSGYNVALLSRTPIRTLGREGGEDTTHFERGVLAADVGDVVVVVAHLHAHDALIRKEEADLLTSIVKRLEADHRKPVIVAGDMNSLSRLDSACHDALHASAFISGKAVGSNGDAIVVPGRLKQKYLLKIADD